MRAAKFAGAFAVGLLVPLLLMAQSQDFTLALIPSLTVGPGTAALSNQLVINQGNITNQAALMVNNNAEGASGLQIALHGGTGSVAIGGTSGNASVVGITNRGAWFQQNGFAGDATSLQHFFFDAQNADAKPALKVNAVTGFTGHLQEWSTNAGSSTAGTVVGYIDNDGTFHVTSTKTLPSCTMSAATSCTATVNSGAVCAGCVPTSAAGTATAVGCVVSSTTLTITASAANSQTWRAVCL